jgi:hypothetical protein
VKISVGLFCFFGAVGIAVMAAVAKGQAINGDAGLSLTTDASTGSFQITATDPKWSVGGTTGKPWSDIKNDQGDDKIGHYSATHFQWNDGGKRTGTIRLYAKQNLVLFQERFEDAVTGSPSAFPVLSKLPANLMAFRYGESDHLRPETFHLKDKADEQYGGPVALFDERANTMIVSPASSFMIAMISGDLQTGIASGLNRTLTGVPAGYEHQTLLAIGKGINKTWTIWGNGLTALYAKQCPANDADTGLKYLGFWTDNGSHYYYNFDLDKGYAGTLFAVRDYFQQHQIPVHYMQLDSWWYPKTFDSVQKKEANKARAKDPRLPAGSWNRYGGLLEFSGAKELFPDGLGAFQKQLAMPLVLHNRWIDPTSEYHNSYKISGIAAVDPKWWDKICSDIAGWGAMTYEQDWNNWIYLKSPELSNTTWAGEAYMDGMANACHANNLTMQYCMVMPRFLMQGGAKYKNLTTVRVSGDRLDRGKWHEFLYGSAMAGALGVWPWTDNYRSTETANILISTLSAGMVGISDKVGEEDTENIFRAVRADGVIVKPDVPLVPVDASYIAEAHADGDGGKDVAPMAVVCETHSGTDAQSADYVFAFTREAKNPQDTPWSVDPAALTVTGPAAAYDFTAATAQKIDQQHPLAGKLSKSHDWTYQVVVPIQASGIALIGDIGKFVTRGRQRIASVVDDGQKLTTVLSLAKGESSITLAAYAPWALAAEVEGGAVSSAKYDVERKIETISITADSGDKTDRSVTVKIHRQ